MQGTIGHKARKHIGAWLLVLIVAMSFGWTSAISGEIGAVSGDESAVAFQTITSAELAEMLQAKDFPLVNVHIPYEGEIALTDAFIPFDEISDHLDQLPRDKAAAIVLYCRSGRMSEIAARELAALGYSNVSHLNGGMIEWEKTGHEILRE